MKSGKTPKKDYVVVDVRDEDFVGGNIKGAINEPSQGFLQNVDGLVKQTKELGYQVAANPSTKRPKSCKDLRRDQRERAERENDIRHEVAILRDGFTEFQVKYKDDSELVENWDKEVWNPSWAMGPNRY